MRKNNTDNSVLLNGFTKPVSTQKKHGATFTPPILADFIAEQMLEFWIPPKEPRPIRIFDPAVGEGELLLSLINRVKQVTSSSIEVYGLDTNENSIRIAKKRINQTGISKCNLLVDDFLEYIAEQYQVDGTLFEGMQFVEYDLLIANPPYVRTQVLGAQRSRFLAKKFELTGRVDLAYAFLVTMPMMLRRDGVAGVITSNRFMTVKAGSSVRKVLRLKYGVRQVLDLGDSNLFNAAVLPAVVILQREPSILKTGFSSVYKAKNGDKTEISALNAVDALKHEGLVSTPIGNYNVRKGYLNAGAGDEVWTLETEESTEWLKTVRANTWKTFGEIGKVRVGIKTCGDNVFIGDWRDVDVDERPELLKPLVTSERASRFHPAMQEFIYEVIYTHEKTEGKRKAVDLLKYPQTAKYLEKYRAQLENRSYVIKAGRQWFEIWVPQDPDAWDKEKLVFRDISEKPLFWMEEPGSVVNGDCYWYQTEYPELLWLALAVGNSWFIEQFYDIRFHNKLYSGRRRFMTQYVEEFPLPDPTLPLCTEIISAAKELYHGSSLEVENKLNHLVGKVFGVSVRIPE